MGLTIRLVALLGMGFPTSRIPSHQRTGRHRRGLVAELGFSTSTCWPDGDTVAQELGPAKRAGRTQWLSCCLLNGGLFPETHRARLVQKLMLTPLGPLLTALMNERQLQRTMGKVFGPDTQPSADLIQHFWELITYNNGRRALNKLISYIPQRITHRERWVSALQTSVVPLALINGALACGPCGLFVVGEPDYRLSLPTIGHYPQVEAPVEVIASYRAFLQNIAG
ncbi:MAG: alpha/beta hydrolase [Haliea sp.]|nr:alpha/beta hydrolase [Haliea sp.]